MKYYTSSELTAMKQEDLVKIILDLQIENQQLQNNMESLREDVANQCKDLEIQEENEINSFRRLSQECAQQNIPIEMPDEKAGSSVDRVGSLTDCVIRSEPAIVSLASYTSGTSGSNSKQFMIGSMQASIQKMSNSLSAFNQLERPQSGSRSIEMKSFTTQGNITQSSSQKQPAIDLNKFKHQSTATPQAVKMQQKKITTTAIIEEESDDNDVVM